MSFRIHATDHILGKEFEGNGDISHQVYGNGDFPKELEEHLTNHGAEIDEDGCFRDFEVTDINELLDVMMTIHNRQVKDDSYWDFKPSPIYKTDTPGELIGYIEYKLDATVVLGVYNFYKAFEGLLDAYWDKGTKYKIESGKHIYLSGY